MLKQIFSKSCNHKWLPIDSLGWARRCTKCTEYQIQQITKEGIEKLNPKLTEWVLLKEGRK